MLPLHPPVPHTVSRFLYLRGWIRPNLHLRTHVASVLLAQGKDAEASAQDSAADAKEDENVVSAITIPIAPRNRIVCVTPPAGRSARQVGAPPFPPH